MPSDWGGESQSTEDRFKRSQVSAKGKKTPQEGSEDRAESAFGGGKKIQGKVPKCGGKTSATSLWGPKPVKKTGGSVKKIKGLRKAAESKEPNSKRGGTP